jgi:hypothetical protein
MMMPGAFSKAAIKVVVSLIPFSWYHHFAHVMVAFISCSNQSGKISARSVEPFGRRASARQLHISQAWSVYPEQYVH